jgi:AcrR family transcriptional regulator
VPFGRPREFDEDQALDQAILTFWRHGYDGASLTDLTAAMGMPKSSLYSVFGSKEELFATALRRYADRDLDYVRRATLQPTALDVATAYLHDNADAVTRRGMPRGCLALQGGLACTPDNADVVTLLSEHRRASERLLSRRFARACKDGDLLPDTDPKALARYLTGVAYGNAVHAVEGASRAALHEAVGIALLAVRALTRSPAPN